MPQLVLYQKYSRSEVLEIFSPGTPYLPRKGSWGLHTIVGLHGRPGDWVFFTTQEQGEGSSEEGITKDGVFTWKSKAGQALKDRQIRQFITHDELRNTIYLFCRQKKQGRYTYLGRLKYLRHDASREKPVYIQWQILDWNISHKELNRSGLVLQDERQPGDHERLPLRSVLRETPPPLNLLEDGITGDAFRRTRTPDFSVEEVRDTELVIAGEKIVIAHEKRALIQAGRADLAHKVRHVAAIEGEHAGYDIESYTPEGAVKYIEVKTTRGVADAPFYLRTHELEFARQHAGEYYLYRVYEYDEAFNAGKLYIVTGDIEELFRLTPTGYRATRSRPS